VEGKFGGKVLILWEKKNFQTFVVMSREWAPGRSQLRPVARRSEVHKYDLINWL
jgi:hypothetical protein